MNAENKAKIIQFVRGQLNNCNNNYQYAFDTIFNDKAYGNKAEKLAALKFLALYSPGVPDLVKKSALAVIELEGVTIGDVEVKGITDKE